MTGKASDELELIIWGGCHALGGGSSARWEAQVLDACRERRVREKVVCGGRLESRFVLWSYILCGWCVGESERDSDLLHCLRPIHLIRKFIPNHRSLWDVTWCSSLKPSGSKKNSSSRPRTNIHLNSNYISVSTIANMCVLHA